MHLFRCQQFSRAPWFRNLSFELKAGEVRLLTGPTGSGKSLFLRGLADLDPVDHGQLWLGTKERAQYSPAAWRRSVLYVHQSAPRIPGSVQANLNAVQSASGTPIPFNPFQLDLEQDAAALSGGEAQLLALTRAMRCDPQVYLLDESTSALDARSAQLAEELLAARLKRGAAILWVSHDERIGERMGAGLLCFGELGQ